MSERIQIGNLSVDTMLHELVQEELVPGTDVEAREVWAGLEEIIEGEIPLDEIIID